MLDLREFDLRLVFLLSVIVMVVAGEAGHRAGIRVGVRDADNVATLEGAIIGLLALMIGFTFAMALSLFETRRDAVLTEANAIGTVGLRARLLPAPYDKESLKLLREYVQIRLDVTRSDPTPQEFKAAIDRSNAIQETLWRQAEAVAAKDNAMVPTGLYIQGLNDMFDGQAKRVTAARHRVPNVVLIVLYGIAAAASAFAGYGSALKHRRWRIPVYMMSLLVCAVIFLIQDLDRPRSGYITVDQQPMIDTAASLASFAD